MGRFGRCGSGDSAEFAQTDAPSATARSLSPFQPTEHREGTLSNLSNVKCSTCGGEMVQKSPLRLFVAGMLMVASLAIAAFVPYFLAPGIILLLAGIYLMVWATVGKGRWCRECKKFS
jgi:hypothetical protein